MQPLQSSPDPVSPCSVTVSVDFDEEPFQGPMRLEPGMRQAKFMARATCITEPNDAGESEATGGVLEVLTKVQQQLDNVIHGQATLQAIVKAGFGSGVETCNGSSSHDDSSRCSIGLSSAANSSKPTEVSLHDLYIEPFSPVSPVTPRRRVKLMLPTPQEGSGKQRFGKSGSSLGDEGELASVPRTERSQHWRGVDSSTPTEPRGMQAGESIMALPCEDPPSPIQRRPKRMDSRSAFDSIRSADEDKQELRTVFLHAEALEAAQLKEQSTVRRLRNTERQQMEIAGDSIIGFIILLNAIFVGVSMDATPSQQSVIFIIDVGFSIFFISELLLKMYCNGCIDHFTGEQAALNIFDAVLVSIDLLQLFLQLLTPDAATRVVEQLLRLARLVRILRLLRHPVLNTLLLMVRGMAGGLPTLGWALIMFILSVYVVALLSREFLGREYAEHISEHFDSVPKSMVTTFRCSFGDCESMDAGPIFEYVIKEYGLGASIFYCLFLFTMSIGMFNVISAIFVQSTLSAAISIRQKQKKARLQDNDLWSTRLSVVVRKIASMVLNVDPSEKLSENIDIIYDLDVSCETMDEIGADPDVRAALDELDVDPEDHEILSDILDVDQNGSVVVIELLQGIKRLRGDPRRSDIVTVNLMCRSLMHLLKEVHQMVTDVSGNRHRIKKM
eukprot:TRINITY_DN25854_c0_g1_i2.p1 TRINITY_DN25854_c0_g1~~TRINITY_DN25854_c0_g1_i2.p1  ORF type:complete len:672 (-),score=145.56 TRINITY_DN25854_c0_g1_i2:167-2182(-)